ncbi:hypothetical protein [Kalamiella sp. sgz302252]|uniref:hypothetical protein n=1 Tax=Pantoea sp. sgz302252 TaxID=3341827 RepID=UPI0036D2FDE2
MEKLTQRVEHLEEDTHQIKLDLAVLTARSENFATKADLAELKAELKSDQYEMRVELLREIGACDMRANARFEKIDEQFSGFNEKFIKIDEQFKRVDERFERVDEQFKRVDERFERVDERFNRVDEQFKKVDEQFRKVDARFESLETKIGNIDSKITWTLLIPALTAIILWFVKTAILKI